MARRGLLVVLTRLPLVPLMVMVELPEPVIEAGLKVMVSALPP